MLKAYIKEKKKQKQKTRIRVSEHKYECAYICLYTQASFMRTTYTTSPRTHIESCVQNTPEEP